MTVRIIVLGGYGVFGGRLARRLIAHPGFEVLVAGRDLAKAKGFCETFGGTPVMNDRDGDVAAAFRQLEPAIVIDAAGPFQAYGDDPYRAAKAAIGCRAHYLDLADDASFVQGILALDQAARAGEVTVISGASSIPAISGAALDELTRDLEHVFLVGSAILPGNRAPRGLSVVRAIVGQAGRPLRIWRGGRWRSEAAWGNLVRLRLAIDGSEPLARLGSPIGAPDLVLFPTRYAARSALFHAGLELPIIHLGLWVLALPVRWRLLGSIEFLSQPLKWIADRLERFGSDRGGMLVYARGRDRQGHAVERRWTLIAEAGDGPEIPPTPAYLLAVRLAATDDGLLKGASPALGQLSLAEIEAGFAGFEIRTARSDIPSSPLLERVLPDAFAKMPATWRRLAEIHDIDCFEGEASVTRGTSGLARLIATIFGFPQATPMISVRVEKRRTAEGERWTRRFGAKPFVSHLSRHGDDAPGILRERFGPFSFVLRLRAENGWVAWPVESWRLLGLPMPRALMPRSETVEFVGEDAKFHFDVGISAPLAGLIVRYKGWLAPS